MKKSFAVIGLGSFGTSLLLELTRLGAEVLAIDVNEDLINNVSKYTDTAVCANSTDESVLRELGVERIDHVIVSIGQNVQDSIMTVIILKEIGVKYITVKVETDYHRKIVQKLGADEVITPEKAAGERLARKIVTTNVVDFWSVDPDYSIYQLKAGKGVVGKTLMLLDSSNKYDINIALIKRGKDTLMPKADTMILEGDELLVVGLNKKIRKFDDKVNK